jgi:Zonular occludens toxin (Zot)
MIIGLSGAIGSGKSFTQLKWALAWAEKRNKSLVFNFRVNRSALRRYCVRRKYRNLIRYIDNDSLSEIVNPQQKTPKGTRPYLEALFIPNSVVLLDEAGIFLNSRDFASTSRSLLSDLCQSRKDGIDIFWAAQFEEQVDKQFRLLTQYWIHCASVAIPDRKTGKPILKWKKIYWFTASDYYHWLSNVRDQASHFRTRLAYASDYEGGPLTSDDKLLFDVYDSFSRLDLQASSDVVRSPLRCPLAKVTRYDEFSPIAPAWSTSDRKTVRLLLTSPSA